MTIEQGLSLRDAVDWCGSGRLTVREVTRLRQLAHDLPGGSSRKAREGRLGHQSGHPVGVAAACCVRSTARSVGRRCVIPPASPHREHGLRIGGCRIDVGLNNGAPSGAQGNRRPEPRCPVAARPGSSRATQQSSSSAAETSGVVAAGSAPPHSTNETCHTAQISQSPNRLRNPGGDEPGQHVSAPSDHLARHADETKDETCHDPLQSQRPAGGWPGQWPRRTHR